MKVVISSGHGKHISGATGPSPWGLHEHEEAVRVVNQTAEYLRAMGVNVITYEDTVSTTQDENLARLVEFHNAQGPHDYDISVHFNDTDPQPTGPLGTEAYYWHTSSSGHTLAADITDDIAINSGLKNRGAKPSSGLYFLKHTNETAVLIEVCFVNSHPDVDIYNTRFADICRGIASAISGSEIELVPPEPGPPEALFAETGRCSWFGGPTDSGVSATEGLAFIYEYNQRPDLFLPYQPDRLPTDDPPTGKATGLARRLNANGVFYVACRWDYDQTPKEMLADRDQQALVRAGNKEALAWPADWGPNSSTGRIADLSPGLMDHLGLSTDDEVTVIYPAPEDVPEPVPEPEPEPPEVATIKIETTGDVRVFLNGEEIT